MEGLSSSSDRARKLFERGVDIVANDIVQGHPKSLLHTPHRDALADSCSSRMSLSGDRWRMSVSQTGVSCGSGGLVIVALHWSIAAYLGFRASTKIVIRAKNK